MKTAIIVFSPTGNTMHTGRLIKEHLEKKNHEVSLTVISGDDEYFSAKDKTAYLESAVPDHDILITGAPVYAHHMQYHMLDLILSLPRPGAKWGKFAVAFVTYGGINSGIALEEAGRLLKKSGRTVIAGAKFSAEHHAVYNMTGIKTGGNRSSECIEELCGQMLSRISLSGNKPVDDVNRKLRYRSRKEFIIDNTVFNEKKWHEKRYPDISVDHDRCTRCQKCVRNCPVNHLQYADGSVVPFPGNGCIHCTKCVSVCPAGAISPKGELERMKGFIEKMISKGVEKPENAVF